MSVTLSTCQEEAKLNFINFLSNQHEQEFCLSGQAGSGKSFLVKHLVKEIPAANKVAKVFNPNSKGISGVVYCATTNKAAGILADAVNKNVETVHSLFSLIMKFDDDTGEAYWIRSNRPVKFGTSDLIFIEESSMVGKDLLKLILANVTPTNKICWLGDSLQLFPVKEDNCPVFVRKTFNAELNTVIRFDNENIKNTCEILRQSVSENKLLKLTENENVKVLSRPEFDARLLKANKEGINCKFIAWTNTRVNAYGLKIHEHLYGTREYSIGQKLMVKKACLTSDSNMLTTQTELIIERQPMDINITLGKGKIDVTMLYTNKGTLIVPKHRAKAMKLLKPLKDAREWVRYNSEVQKLAQVTSAYSITCHQAQSSTYHTVFIDLSNIMRNPNKEEMLRLIYVAASRASHNIYFCK